MKFPFDNTYAREMEGFYVPWKGADVPAPRLVRLNQPLAIELGLRPEELRREPGVSVLAGKVEPQGSAPLTQAYAGHQFGGFSPQLGDGRALLLGEVIDVHGRRRDIQLKGSGKTPFSRGGDGKAALGPVLREYLVSEAMYALGIPTTRALAAVTTGESVFRETELPGAVLTRIASSHIRVGTFQFFAARRDTERLRQLADYSIARHYPEVAGEENRYLAFLAAVCDRQAALIAAWMGVGFVHGVMNTDNMTISGETIDYGPCAFIDSYAPGAVFSSIDTGGRYAYANQPVIAQWNLARLAETLLDLVDDDTERAVELCSAKVNAFPEIYVASWLERMRAKLGMETPQEGDLALVNDLYQVMEGQNVDFTRFFRAMSRAAEGDDGPVRALFDDPAKPENWIDRWRSRLLQETKPTAEIAESLVAINPLYIPRNHLVEAALNAAVADGDMAPFDKLAGVLGKPFEACAELGEFETAGSAGHEPYRTFCGT
jgi:uncharacterized protein YdiU (UPF0061 family)